MKILLFGANGQVGRECVSAFARTDWEMVCLVRKQADFTNPESVYRAVVDHAPDIVVNACAYTAVDKAESEPDIATQVNAESIGEIGRAASELDIPVIHISTDYVFSGKANKPYVESDTVDPVGVYGRSKLAGEQRLFSANRQSIVLRTSWVFSAHGSNFVKTILRLGAERDELGVVADQFGCPTSAKDIVEVITELLIKYQKTKELPWGLYHCSGHGICSWHEFSKAVFDCGVTEGILDKAPTINAITTADYPTPAARPEYSALNCSKLEQLLGRPMPDWRLGLEVVCSELNVNKS